MFRDPSLAVQHDLFFSLVENSLDVVFLVDQDHRISYANRRACEVFGWDRLLQNQYSASDLPSSVEKLYLGPTQPSAHDFKDIAVGLDWWEFTSQVVNFGEQTLQQCCLRDITNRKAQEFNLRKEAVTDDLSGLCNRRQFRRQLDRYQDDNLALAVVDVDHFKLVNDQHGHCTGDSAIRFVASKLLQYFEMEICVARLGGEEFGIVMQADNRDFVVSGLESFRIAIEHETQSELSLDLTVSIGVAFSNLGDVKAFNLLERADQALYTSKRNGRNRLTVAD